MEGKKPMPGTDIELKPASKKPADKQKPISQDDLVADIDRTRQELAATIDAISDRLNPANAARRAVERVRERVAQVDPVLAGSAAVAVAGLAIAYVLLRRRKR
jgi:hypothetical protein